MDTATQSPSDSEVAGLLASHTYEEVRAITGPSRGAIYRIALRLGVRQHEHRIQQRREERRCEQEAFLRSMLDNTADADALDFLAELPDDGIQRPNGWTFAHSRSRPRRKPPSNASCCSHDPEARSLTRSGFLVPALRHNTQRRQLAIAGRPGFV